jgi:hypothetical protein
MRVTGRGHHVQDLVPELVALVQALGAAFRQEFLRDDGSHGPRVDRTISSTTVPSRRRVLPWL